MRYRLVIFDLDGTILDTIPSLTNAFNLTRDEFRLPRLPEETVKSYIGNGARRLVERSLEGITGVDIDAFHRGYRRNYELHCLEKTEPYEGIADIMRSLHAENVKVAVVTNKSQGPAERLCEHFYPGLVDIVRGHIDKVPHKPDPTIVNRILQSLDIEPSQALVIGDSDVDRMTAANSGTDFIGVAWGYGNPEDAVSDPDELKALIR